MKLRPPSVCTILFLTLLMASCDNSDTSADPYDRDGDEPIFMALSRDSPKLAVAVAQARKTLPDFIDAFSAGRHEEHGFLVKSLFIGEDGDDRAHIWTAVRTIHEGDLACYPLQIPTGFTGLKEDQLVLIPPDSVEDWMINADGEIYGAYSLRLQRELTPDSERASFDDHIGLKKFTDQKP